MLPEDSLTLSKIIKAAQEERDKRAPFWRTYRNELIGRYWREGLGTKRVSNHVYAYQTIMTAMLAFRDPHVKLRAKFGAPGRMIARVFEAALDDTIARRRLLEVLRASVANSLYAVGVVKTGVEPLEHDPNILAPFAESISPFRLLWDDSATHWRRMQYVGHEFDMNLDDVLSDPRYDVPEDVLIDLETSHSRSGWADTPGEGDQTRGETRDDLLRELPVQVRLAELYLRDSHKIVTLLRRSADDWVIIGSHPVTTSRGCPYHLLGYTWMEEAVMPIAPAHGWWEQWRELEKQERKMMRQVEQEKTVVAFSAAGKSSAEIIKEAEDFSIVTNINEIGKQVTWGGITEPRLLAVTKARMNFEAASGLTDVKRGGPNTSGDESATMTAAKDRYANLTIDDMLTAVAAHAADIVNDWKRIMWADPNVVTTFTFTDPQAKQEYDITMRGGEEPEGDLPLSITDADFHLEIKRDSLLRPTGPIERAQALQMATFLIGPMAQVAMFQGYMPDVIGILKMLNEAMGRDDLDSYFIPLTPVAQALAQMSAQAGATPFAVESVAKIDAAGRARESRQNDVGAAVPGPGVQSQIQTDNPANSAAGYRSAPMSVGNRIE